MFQQARLFQFQEPQVKKSFRWGVAFDDGSFVCSVVPEKRGNKVYWYMRKVRNGKTANIYIAPAGKLSEELLDNAVKHIKAYFATTQEQGAVLQ